MDCPTCGLANPPEALRYDCGYDFAARKPSETPGWQIDLTWGQKVAAYWSISWPAWVAAGFAVMLFRRYFVDHLRGPVIALGGNLAFFAIQTILTRRLVRKNYHGFRVDVLREDGQRTRGLSMREASRVWLWILGPQLALFLIASLIVSWPGATLRPETVSAINTWSLLLRFLMVGPYAVHLALRAQYPRFRLQAYGYNTKISAKTRA
jgi:hypothetical protein